MPELSRVLHELLGRETDSVSRLFDVLVAEHAALEKRDADELGRTVAEKQTLVAALEVQAGERLRLLQAHNLSPDRAGFEALLDQAGVEDETRELWARLRERLEACQHQNQLNGMLIEPGRQGTQQALAILLGDSDTTQLYNQKGAAGPASVGGRTSFKV